MQENIRLIHYFKPENYNLFIKLDRQNRSFDGRVKITGESNQTEQNVLLHAKDLTIHSVLIDGGEAFFCNGDHDSLIIKKNGAQANNIEISFSGKINDSMHGIYPCYYKKDGQEKELIATQFESHSAREAFPCIDEPEAKATFDLTIETEKDVVVLGNMPVLDNNETESSRITSFETSPRMSTYLLAWVVGDLHKKTTHTNSGIEVNVYSTVSHPLDSLDFALDIAKRSTEFFEEYFDTPYPLSKCDHVALPDFAAGAMENWGLITYRESMLLVDKTTSIESKHHVALVVAHELSHQWFGNLVTMKWWDDLWLNESFATIIEYIAIDALEPEWNIWLDYANNEVIRSTRRDSLGGVQPVKLQVNHPDEIETLFDGSIVYAKGSRLINMIRQLIGEDAFKKGLHEYFNTHSYKNTEATDLWQSFNKVSDFDISAIMTKWLTQPGLPVVRVDLKDNSLAFGQNRLLDVSDTTVDESTWQIPLFSNDDSLPRLFENKNLETDSNKHEKIRINTGCYGHYVVNYSDNILDSIYNDLENNNLQIIDRIQFINDQSLLAKNGITSHANIVRLLTRYQREQSEPVWDSISIAFGELKKFASSDGDIDARLKRLGLALSKDQLERLTIHERDNDSDSDKKLRGTIIGMSVYGENREIIDQAINEFNSKALEDINPELRSLIISTKVKHDHSDELIDRLINDYKHTNSNELKLDICSGLTNTDNHSTVEKLLELIKDTTTIKKQDSQYWLVYLLRNRHSRKLAWQWTQDNWQWLEDTFSSEKSFCDYPRYIATCLMDEVELEQYKKLFIPMIYDPALTRAIKVGINELSAKVESINRDKENVRAALSELQ